MSILAQFFCKYIYLVFTLNRPGSIKKNNGRTYQYASLSRHIASAMVWRGVTSDVKG